MTKTHDSTRNWLSMESQLYKIINFNNGQSISINGTTVGPLIDTDHW